MLGEIVAETEAAKKLRDVSIAVHIGAPHTDNGQLTWSLRKDVKALSALGVMIRRPGTYKKDVGRLLEKQTKEYVTDEERELLLARIIKKHKVSRLILTDPSFLGVPAWMLNGGRIYQNAGRNTGELRELFRQNRCELFLGIRNPATFVPAVFQSQTLKTWEEFTGGADLLNLRWSQVVKDILADNPDCPITVWCNEDTPLIWPKILKKVAGIPSTFRFAGEHDILRKVMSEQGVQRLENYLAERPELTEAQRVQVQSLFLKYFHSEEAVEEEIELPGWSQHFVDDMTDVYLDDIAILERMPEITFIS